MRNYGPEENSTTVFQEFQGDIFFSKAEAHSLRTDLLSVLILCFRGYIGGRVDKDMAWSMDVLCLVLQHENRI